MKGKTDWPNNSLDEAITVLRGLPYKKGAYASRYWGHPYHSMISYPSKLKPSIAHFLVRLFTKQNETVLDPFSGVGTVPFEACAQGRIGIGTDLSPIGYHSTLSKVDPPSVAQVHSVLEDLSRFIAEHRQDATPSHIEDEILAFYHEDTLKEILASKEFFTKKQGNPHSYVLTCMLHILHGNRPYALSRRSHNIMPWPPKGEFIYKPVMKSLSEKSLRMASCPLPIDFRRGQSFTSDVMNLPLPDNSVDAVITSPPFYANRDFLRMNRIRLWFCGWDYEFQNKMKDEFLEHMKDFGIYKRVFDEFARVLKPSKPCIMHVGVVKNFNMCEELVPIAEKRGFSILETIDEDTSDMESQGIRDRGATHTHQFLIMTSPA